MGCHAAVRAKAALADSSQAGGEVIAFVMVET